jgi:archaellum biogenesis ATPase FlaH
MAALYGIPELGRILELARRVPVFPCQQNKRPYVGNGFHAATQDEKQIRQWWAQWPNALVGVPTGQATGLVVLDYDPDKATSATHQWMSDHTELLCSTRTHSTARGGKHYLFRSTDRYQTGTNLVLSGSPRGGLDLRANGGYIIWWPIHGGEVGEEKAAPVPAGLIDERLFRPERDMAPLPETSPAAWAVEAPKVIRALEHITPEGYDAWIRIGMAIHSASGGSDQGFGLWHDWSTRGPSYDGIEDCRYHWASFGRYQGRGVGLGSLFQIALANGYVDVPPPPEVELPPLDAYGDLEGEAVEDVPGSSGEPAKGRLLEAGFWAGEARTHIDLPYLVKGLFDRGQMIVLWGPPGSGKTFAALSLGAHIGAGKSWAGRRVKRGKVLYVCAESTRKRLENRMRALLDAYPELDNTELFLVPLTLDLLNGDADILAVLAACEQIEDVALIVVDTLAVTFGGGDENSSEDMGKYVSNMKLLKDRTGAAVLIVHHCGKDEARGMRGHSSLLGALDGELAVERPEDKGPRIFRAGKLREGESFCDLFTFDLTLKELGTDVDGDPVTTCYVVPNGFGPVLRRPSHKAQLAMLKALEDEHRAGQIVWTEADVRRLVSSLMHRNSVRNALFALNEAGWLKAAVGGWMLTQEPQ